MPTVIDGPKPTKADKLWMRKAIELATTIKAAPHSSPGLSDVPIAALIVSHDPEVLENPLKYRRHKESSHPGSHDISQGFLASQAINKKERSADPTQHAELVAISRASQILGRWRLNDCTLYTTLEPCVMCTGAIIQARIARVVFSCYSPKFGALGSLYDMSQDPSHNHSFEVISGLMEAESSALLREFFKEQRAKKE